MHGRPLIANTSSRSLSVAEHVTAVLVTAAVGAAAGLVAAQVRLHLGLPGHKVLFWLTPVLAARLILGGPAGATAGAVAAAMATAAAGGNLAGSFVHLPLIGVAGLVLDVAAWLAERGRLAAAWAIPLMGLAGLAANLVCLGKRLLAPWWGEAGHTLWGVNAAPISYALFGLLAGLLGATAAWLVLRRTRRGTQ
jgi:hypothetical protein